MVAQPTLVLKMVTTSFNAPGLKRKIYILESRCIIMLIGVAIVAGLTTIWIVIIRISLAKAERKEFEEAVAEIVMRMDNEEAFKKADTNIMNKIYIREKW